MSRDEQRDWDAWIDRRELIRSRKSYRLLILSGRGLFCAAAVGALIQILSSNDIIGPKTTAVLILPFVLLFVVSWLVGVVTLAITAAHVSQTPIARSLTERQLRVSGMLFVDLLTLRYAARAPRRPRRARM